MTRVCRRCQQALPPETFWDGYKWCKPCRRAYDRWRWRVDSLAELEAQRFGESPVPYYTGRISPLRGRWRV